MIFTKRSLVEQPVSSSSTSSHGSIDREPSVKYKDFYEAFQRPAALINTLPDSNCPFISMALQHQFDQVLEEEREQDENRQGKLLLHKDAACPSRWDKSKIGLRTSNPIRKKFTADTGRGRG